MEGILYGTLIGIVICVIGWLIAKLVSRIWGEFAILRPFDYVEGLVEDFLALFEEMPKDWREFRRWRRESEARQRERDRANEAIIAEQDRQRREAEEKAD